MSQFYFSVASRYCPTIAVKSALMLFYRPFRPQKEDSRPFTLKPDRAFTLCMDSSATLQVYEWGAPEAPGVLLVHGWFATAKSMEHFVPLLLAKGYRVIAYDAIGHGNSKGGISDLAGWAESVRTVMAHTGTLASVIAHSFGCAAVTVASQKGLRTRALVYLAPIYDLTLITESFSSYFGIPSGVITAMYHTIWQTNRAYYEKYGDSWQSLFRSSFHVPTLIFHDMNDRVVTIAHSEKLCRQWHWAILRKTSGLGHRKILQDASVLQECVTFVHDR
jgi:pimeloyl-ACP methyl ester carboxylesterase